MLQEVTTLANLRKDNMALLYGDTEVLSFSDKEMVVLRNYFDQTAVLFINSSREEKRVTVEVPVHYNLESINAVFGNQFSIDGRTITVVLPPVSFDILTQ
jgi:glycosidase